MERRSPRGVRERPKGDPGAPKSAPRAPKSAPRAAAAAACAKLANFLADSREKLPENLGFIHSGACKILLDPTVHQLFF